MRISEITSRDSFDRMKYNNLVMSIVGSITSGIHNGADLELLCERYLTLKRTLLGLDISNDPELIEGLTILQSTLIAEGGARYLSESIDLTS